MSKSSGSSRGVVFLDLLAILFIGLKLTGYITWSWLWVLSPLWIPFAILISLLGLFGLISIFIILIYALITAFTYKKKLKR
jgi:hypothetical protein